MQEENYSIKNWAKDDRPREKLRERGAQQLSNSELIAILLCEGTRSKGVMEVAREVLQLGRNNLNELGKLMPGDFMKVHGVGEAKALTICAALELGRRRQSIAIQEKPVIRDSTEVAVFLQSMLRDYSQEAFGLIFLNRANRVKHCEIISYGGITATVADPRIIFKKALAEDAVGIILFHNHPSGSVRPSRADEELTHKIVSAGKLFDIAIVDHIIVSDEGYFSFADQGLL